VKGTKSGAAAAAAAAGATMMVITPDTLCTSALFNKLEEYHVKFYSGEFL
jgi:hypothetical protein